MKAIEYIYGIHVVEQKLVRRPNTIQKIILLQQRNDARMQKIISLCKQHNIKIEYADRQGLNQLTGDERHQGVAALLRPMATPTWQESDLIDLIKAKKDPRVLLLDGIQDPHNLGACLRSANAFGVAAVIAPKDRSVGLTSTVHKVACGATETTPFISVTNLARTMRLLKENGFWIFGFDQNADTELHKADFKGAVALVFGNEGSGLRQLTRQECDFIVSIPMLGDVESLNVSVSVGIGLFAATKTT